MQTALMIMIVVIAGAVAIRHLAGALSGRCAGGCGGSCSGAGSGACQRPGHGPQNTSPGGGSCQPRPLFEEKKP